MNFYNYKISFEQIPNRKLQCNGSRYSFSCVAKFRSPLITDILVCAAYCVPRL